LVFPGVPNTRDIFAYLDLEKNISFSATSESDIRRLMKTGELCAKDEAVRLPIQAVFIGVHENGVGLGCSLRIYFCLFLAWE